MLINRWFCGCLAILEQDGSNWGIYGQRLDSSGNAIGSEFQVNTYTTSGQARATVTALDNGFLVAWDQIIRKESIKVYGQLYDASGGKIGSEFA